MKAGIAVSPSPVGSIALHRFQSACGQPLENLNLPDRRYPPSTAVAVPAGAYEPEIETPGFPLHISSWTDSGNSVSSQLWIM